MFRIKNVRNATVSKNVNLSPAFSKPIVKPPSRNILSRNINNRNNFIRNNLAEQSKNNNIRRQEIKISQINKIQDKSSHNKNNIFQKKQTNYQNTIVKRNINGIVNHNLNQIKKQTHKRQTLQKKQQSKEIIDKKLGISHNHKNIPIKGGNRSRIIDRKNPILKIMDKVDNIKIQSQKEEEQNNQLSEIESKNINNNNIQIQKQKIEQQKYQAFLQEQIILKRQQQEQQQNKNKNKQQQQQFQKRQRQKQKQKQLEKQQKRLKKLQQQQQQRKKQKQLIQQMQRIQQRRRKRQLEKHQKQKKQNIRKQLQIKLRQQININNINNNGIQEVTGLIHLPEELAHFQMQQIIMDAQVNKILKASFNHFPNGHLIQAQKGQLQRINMSYTMVRQQQNHPLSSGLKNFRTQIFNRIGMLIMQAQNQGFRHQSFSIIQGDSRIPLPLQNVSISKGLHKKYIDQISKTVTMKNDEDCSICLNIIQKGEIGRLLQCNHCFHSQCIDSWLQNNANCPSCRYNVKFGNRN